MADPIETRGASSASDDGANPGIWWHVGPEGDRIRLQHGETIDGVMQPPRAIVLVSLPAALELAVGIVHAALDVDAETTQAAMLALWVRDVAVDD